MTLPTDLRAARQGLEALTLRRPFRHTSIALALLILLFTPSPATGMTTCALEGQYSMSADVAAPDRDAQIFGHFTFVPPSDCVAQATGVAHVALEVVPLNEDPPSLLKMSLPYQV